MLSKSVEPFWWQSDAPYLDTSLHEITIHPIQGSSMQQLPFRAGDGAMCFVSAEAQVVPFDARRSLMHLHEGCQVGPWQGIRCSLGSRPLDQRG